MCGSSFDIITFYLCLAGQIFDTEESYDQDSAIEYLTRQLLETEFNFRVSKKGIFEVVF